MTDARPILITGLHRSGTTWVGRMLAASPSVVYIHEPFRPNHDIGLCKVPFNLHFTYVTERNEQTYYIGVKDTIEFRYNIVGKIKLRRNLLYWYEILKKYLTYRKYRISQLRPLLKAPTSIFMAEWLSKRFLVDTLILTRHPAAFAASLKARNWTHPFSHFLKQPLLMEEHLQPFKKEIQEFAEEEKDILEQAALLWNINQYMVLKYQKTHPEWIFLRHEDLSREPIAEYRSLFGRLGLDFSPSIAEEIIRYSSPRISEKSVSETAYEYLKRDSLANIKNWKERLTTSEINHIKSRVCEISKEFYSEEEW